MFLKQFFIVTRQHISNVISRLIKLDYMVIKELRLLNTVSMYLICFNLISYFLKVLFKLPICTPLNASYLDTH